jgi:protoheme IX farnesyltransferase
MTELTNSNPPRPRWQDYYEICKPKVVMLISFTAIVGMLLSTAGMVPLQPLFFGTLGITLAAACGAAINHVVDQRIDALMDRTKNRPVATGQLSQRAALTFALTLGVISMLVLVVFVNQLTAVLTFVSIIGYAVIYTMYLKRTTHHNIVLGGIAGAAPPLLGWTAVRGEVHTEALLLFLIIVIWTPPHFWPLAIKRRDDYARAKIPMLPVTHGVEITKLNILLYTLVLVAVTILPFVIEMSGLIYLAGAISLGMGFLYHVIKFYRDPGDGRAMRTFGYSIFYLNGIFIFLLLDHYARIFIRAFFL